MNTTLGDRKHRDYSLALLVDMWVGIAAVLAMAVCVLAQYLRAPDTPLAFLLSHHIQDLLVLGLMFWTVSWLVLRIALVSPLREIFAHLYRIGGGDRTPIKMRVRVTEIQSIAESINVMLWRLNDLSEAKRLKLSHDMVSDARALLNDISEDPSKTAQKVDDSLEQLQMVLHQAIQNHSLRRERTRRHKEMQPGEDE